MTLHVRSARITYAGPDRLDVTRKSAGPDGLPFAPSWKILIPALRSMRRAKALMDEALRLAVLPETMRRESEFTYQFEAEEVAEKAWRAYEQAYLAEMRESYRFHRPAWDAILARESVVLVCFCTDHERCHRYLLRTRILPALGAVDAGEIRA